MTKIKETQRYFAIRKQNYAALVINKEYYCLFVISGFYAVYLVSSVTANKLSRVTSSSTIAECFPGKTPYVVTIVMRVLQRVAVSARNIAIRSRNRRS